MTHAPRHMAHRSKRIALVDDLNMRKAVSAGMTVAIPSVGAIVAAAPSMAATDSTSASAPLNATAAAKTAATHSTVMFGSRGADVQALQKVVGVNPDGAFGPLTLAAVKAYQKSHGLVADGIVGPLTWAAVDGAAPEAPTSPAPNSTQAPAAQKPATTTPAVSVSTPATQAPATPAPVRPAAPKTIWVGSTDSGVKVLQSKLGVTVTGVFTNDLKASVKAYQSAHGLVPDGVVGPLTWGQIGVSASDVATLAPTLTVVTPAKPAATAPVTTPAANAVTTPAAKPAAPVVTTPAANSVTTPAVTTPAAKPAVPVVTTPAVTPAAKPVVTPAVATPVIPMTTTTPVVTVATTTTSTPQVASASAQQIIDFAKSFLGTPYFYGGNGPASFDCSGFTSYVFSHFGYTMPRTAEQQHAYFTPTTNPQPGDLLFYGTNPAYHVAIYLGNGMMIDDNHPGGSVGIRAVYGTPSGYARVINP